MCVETSTSSSPRPSPATASQSHQQEQRQQEGDAIVEATLSTGSSDTSHDANGVDKETPPTEKSVEDHEDPTPPSRCRTICRKIIAFYWEYEFLILVVLAIGLAKAYPPLGGVYLQPDITASWIAVVFIFLMAGLSLKTSEFSNAFKQVYFNGLVQIFNFGVTSSVVFGISRLLVLGNIVGQDLADGMAIAASVPMTINMVQVMTKASGGDEAAAIFNAAFGNLIGVFLSPALILGYLGVNGNVDMVDVFYKLAARVLLPIVVGQILQYTSKHVMNFVKQYKKYFKYAQVYALVFIVYTVFCKTFMKHYPATVGSVFIMIAFIFLLIGSLMIVAWFVFRFLYPNQPELYIMALYGCTHKTVAMGIPLVSTIYNNNPAIGLYTLPLIVWHSIQLCLGSVASPKLAAFVEREEARLKAERQQQQQGDDQQTTKSNHDESSSDDLQKAAEEGRVTSPTSTVIMTGMMAPEPAEDNTE